MLVITMVCSYCAKLLIYLMVAERKIPFSTLEEAIQDESVEFHIPESNIARSMLQVNDEIPISKTLTNLWGDNEYISTSIYTTTTIDRNPMCK